MLRVRGVRAGSASGARTASWRPNTDPGLSWVTMDWSDSEAVEREEAVDLPVAGRGALLVGDALVEGRLTGERGFTKIGKEVEARVIAESNR